MHPDDMRRGEVIKHAEQVRKGRVPRVGRFVMDAPAYSSVQHLKTLAGYVPPGAIETLTIARSAELERNRESWIEADHALKPDELTDSEDEDDEDVEDKKGERRLEGETKEEHAARMKALREQTDREIRAAERQLAERGVKYVWTVYHDGDFTPA